MSRLLLLTYEYPPDRGGVSAYLGGLFGAMPKDAVRAKKFRMRTFPLAWLLDAPRAILAAASLPKLVVISHLLPMGYVVRFLKRCLGLPYAVIVHGLDARLAARPSKIERSRRILNDAALVIAVSEATRADVQRLFGIRSEVLTPCPSEAMIARAGRGPSAAAAPMILSVGRFVRRKGFDLLLEAFRRLAGDAATLVLAGAGPEEAALRTRARELGVETRVRFEIAPSADRLAELYRQAAIFALAPREIGEDVEGYGIVYLEAGLFGLPVIGARTGGVSEAIVHGTTGLLVPPEDPDVLAEALKTLLNDTARARAFGEEGRRRATACRWSDRAEAFLRLAGL